MVATDCVVEARISVRRIRMQSLRMFCLWGLSLGVPERRFCC